MLNLFLIGIGGFLGSVLRYLCSGWFQSASKSVTFPFGTLAVNVLGCFVIGILAQLSDSHHLLSQQSRLFLIVGVLGGFTTFSTFGNESFNLFLSNESMLSVLNIGSHIFLGIIAVWGGRACVGVFAK